MGAFHIGDDSTDTKALGDTNAARMFVGVYRNPAVYTNTSRDTQANGQGRKKLLVYNVLKRRIIAQAMKPGEPINEGMLARDLQVSKTPIREAVQQLEREGFIENIPGKGNFVSYIAIQDLRELFEIREMLECEAIRRAATRRDPQKLATIRSGFELNGGAVRGDSPREFRAGEHIHLFIFESLGNQRLLEIYRRLHDHIARHRNYFFSDVHEGRPEKSYQEHLEILDALAAQDAARCEHAMRVHLRNSLDYVKSII